MIWEAPCCARVLGVANNQSLCALLARCVKKLEDGEAFDVRIWVPSQVDRPAI